jgi:hypothetical protein
MPSASFPIAPPPDDAAPTPASTLDSLLGEQTRIGPPIRASLIQEFGGKRAPGPLHLFVAERRLFALQLYLLLHCQALKDPWDKQLPAGTWARALGKTNRGAESTVSRSWAWLKDNHLVTTEIEQRMVRAYLLNESGNGQAYTRPTGRFFRLPLAFFRDGWHQKLKLPGTAVLLIALSKSWREPWFELRTQRESEWFGIGADTLQRGLDELRDAELLFIHPRKVHDAKARFGVTTVNNYLLTGPFGPPVPDEPAAES